jgi:hypothetical protein
MSNKSKYLLAAVIALGMSPLATSAFAENNYQDWGYWGASNESSGQTYNYVPGAQANGQGQAEESHKKTPRHH